MIIVINAFNRSFSGRGVRTQKKSVKAASLYFFNQIVSQSVSQPLTQLASEPVSFLAR